MSLRGNHVFVVRKESRSSTERSPGGLRLEATVVEKESRVSQPSLSGLGAGKISNASVIFDNPIFAYDPGSDQSLACDRPMDLVGNGGNQGGAAEAPTRPKFLVGASSGSAHGQSSVPEFGLEAPEFGNWHAAKKDGLRDLDGIVEGEVDMEDDDVLVLDEEEEELPPEIQQRWRLLGTYILQRKPDIDDMTTHFNAKVWRLRYGVNFAPIGKNWFKITLYSEGDFNFVSQGGPWIYRGYTLLVAKVQGDLRPSETELNTVPLWVHVYDMPWNRQKKGTAMQIGNRLGKYLTADLDAEGNSPYDFLRVRVEIPIDQRLKQSITTQVKGKEETATFVLRYERVPYFCFWCGFIGHDDTECEKKRIGIPSLEYDSRLRCSPVRKFERRQAYGPPQKHPQIKKGLKFSSSDENSATLGVPADRRRNSNVVRHTGNHIPSMIDTWDGFEEHEKEGSAEVDNELAHKINHLNLPLVCVGDGLGKVRSHKKSAVRPGRGRGAGAEVSQGVRADKKVPDIVENTLPIAMYPAFPSASYLAGLGSEEMIPPLRGLGSFVFSAGDTLMSDADSILGKRGLEQQECDSADRSKISEVEGVGAAEGSQKKGRREVNMAELGGVRTVLEATSLGAAGLLTGSRDAACQGQ
ncbi:hypothetical protein ACQ4PT_002186 [Festuca glaucescens]